MSDHLDYDKVLDRVLDATETRSPWLSHAEVATEVALAYGDDRAASEAKGTEQAWADAHADEWEAMRAVCDAAAALQENWHPAVPRSDDEDALAQAIEAWQASEEDS